MDDLLREFVTETNESLDVVDVELVRFEQDPNNAKILDNVFRLVHTIKGTCGFIGLPRLEALAHAAETLMGKFRDGLPATSDAVTLILATIDRIKEILESLETRAARAGRRRRRPDRRPRADGRAGMPRRKMRRRPLCFRRRWSARCIREGLARRAANALSVRRKSKRRSRRPPRRSPKPRRKRTRAASTPANRSA